MLTFLSILLSTNMGFADGTKQLEPSAELPYLRLAIYWAGYSAAGGFRNPFATVGCDPKYRLNITITNTSTESIYFGFNDAGAQPQDLYYQLRDPNGVVVVPWAQAQKTAPLDTPGFIQDWNEASNGPDLGAMTAGYTPIIYSNPGGPTGDYYFEFASSNTGSPFSSGHTLRFFDITVVGSASNIIDGRVWSQAWQFGDNSTTSPRSEMYIYSDDGIVTKLNINNWRGGHFFINCNQWGAKNTSDWNNDRKSFDYGSGNPNDLPQYKEFLTIPDETVFPTGTFGTICPGSFHSVSNCDGSVDFKFKVTKSGIVTLNITTPLGPTSLTKDDVVGAADCSIESTIHWDGTVGGVPVTSGFTVSMSIDYLNGLTNLPCNDIESSTQGIQVDIVKPISGKLGIMWDDTDPTIGGGSNINYATACVYTGTPTPSGCHNFGDGDTRIMNSWWYYLTTSTESLAVDILQSPITPNYAPTGPTQVCKGATGVVYTIAPIQSASNYVWQLPAGVNIVSGAGTNTITVDFSLAAVPGNITVYGTNTSGCADGGQSLPIAVTIIDNPAPTISGGNNICRGTSVTYITLVGNTNYLWNVSAGGTITAGGTATDNTVTVQWNTAGAQTVAVSYVISGLCTVTMPTPYAVTVKALPVPTITGPSDACVNSTGNIYFTEPGMTVYTWNVTGGTITAGAATNTITVTWTAVGNQTVSVIYTAADGCVAAPATDKPVTVHALPTPTVTSGPATACAASSGNVYTTQAGMSAYIWNIPAGGTITAGAGTNSVTVTWNTAGARTITVNYSDANGCTAATPTVFNVTVNPLPVPVIVGSNVPCLNESIIYTTAAGMTGYTWTVSAGGAITAGGSTNAATVSWNAGGAQTVSVSYTDANGCAAAAATVYNITVNTLPVPLNNGPSPVCLNSTGNVYTTDAGMTGYVWNVSTGGTVTAGGGAANNTVTVTWNTAGPQSVTVNYNNTSNCAAAAGTVKAVTVNPLPVPTVSGPSSACLNSVGNIYSTETGMTGYTWVVSAGGTITSGAGTDAITVTWTTTGPKTVSVNYTDANSCTAATPTVYNVTVNSLPIPTITGAAAACINSTGNIYTTEAGMSGYSWTITPGGTITAGAGTDAITVTWNTAAAQTITVNYINANNCTAPTPSSKPVTINPLPVPTVSGPASICDNSTGNVYVTEAGHAGYVWSVPAAGGTITSGATTSSITVTWNNPGTFPVTATWTDANGCQGTSAVYNVTVNPLPVPVIGGPVATCESVPVNIYTTTAGMSGYSWTVSPGNTIVSGPGTNTLDVTWNVPGANTLSLNYTDLNGCTALFPTTMNVTVNNYPVASTGPDDYICTAVPLTTYTFSNSTPLYHDPLSIQWTFFGSGFTAGGSLNNSTLQQPTYTAGGADLTAVNRLLYFVQTVNGTGSCAAQIDRDTIELRIDPIPVANAGPNDESCGLNGYTLNASTALYQNTITWTSSGLGGFSAQNISNPVYTPDITDVGTIVQLTMSLVGCHGLPNNSSMWLTVHPEPIATISGTTAICQGDPTPISITFTGTAPWSVTYTNGMVPVTVNNIMSSPYTFNITPSSNTALWLSAANDQFCTAPAANLLGNATITVNPLPNIFNITGSNGGFYCAGDPGVTIGLDNSEIGMTYELLLNNAPVIPGGLILPGTGSPLNFGIFTTVGQYSVLGTNPVANCQAMMNDTITVVMNPIPVVDFTTNTACSGDTTYFNITSTGGFINGISTWHWDFGDGTFFSSSFPVNPVKHVYPTHSTYPVTLSVTDTNNCHYSVTHPVVVVPHPLAFFSFDTPNCLGSITHFTDLSQPNQGFLDQWIWDFGDGSAPVTINFPATANPTHTYANPGTYTVILTVRNSLGCTGTYQTNIVVTERPIADFTYQSNCEDQAALFYDHSSENGGGQIVGWNWNFGDPPSGALNFSTNDTTQHIYTNSGTYTVTLIVTNLNGCTDTIQKNVTVQTAPAAEFISGVGCLGTPTHFWADTLVIDTLTTASYHWDFGDSHTSTARNTSNIYATAGTYTVTLTITDISGCTGTISHDITVNPNPTAHFSANADNCQGQSVAFNDLSVPNSGFINKWVWDFGDGNSQTILHPAIPNTNHTYAGTGTYPVTLTVTNSEGCSSFQTRLINILSAPAAAFISSGKCVGTAVLFTDKSTIPAPQTLAGWNWNFGEPTSGINNTSALQNPSHSYASAGTYTVTLITFSGNNCSDTITQTVTIKALPFVDFSSTAACTNNPTQFTPATAMVPATIGSWLWNFGDGATAFIPAPQHSYAAAGTYTVTLSVTDTAGCSNIRTHTVTISESPQAGFSSSAPGCQGDIINFTNTTPAPSAGFIARYLWDFGDGNTMSVNFPATPNVTHTYANAGTFNVSLMVKTNDSCSDIFSRVITIDAKPTAEFMHGASCLGSAVTFNDLSNSNSTGSISGWNWTFGDPTSGTANTSTLQNPTHIYNTAGSYTVRLIVTVPGGCSDTITHPVVVSAPPTVDFTSIAGCNNDTTKFTSTVNLVTTQGWYWQFGDGTTSFVANPIHIYATAGTYTVTLTITDTAGCTNSRVKPVIVIPGPLAAFASSSPGCSGLPITLTDMSTANGGSLSTWFWTFGDGTDTTYTSSTPTLTHTYSQPGTFNITLKVISALGCEHTVNHTVSISPSPISAFNYANTCQGQSTQFTDMTNLNGGSSLTLRSWDFGDPASGIQNTSTLANPTHTYTLPGAYTVVLTTVNASGCSDSLSRSVVITLKPGIDFYNDSLICLGSTVTLYTDTTVTPVGAIQYYNWDFGDGSPHAFTRNASHTYTQAGTYLVRLSIQDTSGCENTKTHSLTIHPQPVSSFSFSGMCENAPTQFTDLSVPPAGDTIVSWYWDFGIAGSTTDTSTLQNPVFTFTVPATYSVKLTTTTEHGCSHTKTLPVQVWNIPTAWFKYTSIPCANGLVQFQDSSWSYQGTISSWQWEFEPFQYGTGTHPSHLYYAVDSCYDVTLSITDMRGCVDDTTLSVCVLAPFTVDFLTTNTCFGNPVTFTPQLVTPEAPADSLITFNWNFGDPATGTNNVSQVRNPVHMFSKVGSYLVNFTSTDKFGCTATHYKNIDVHALPIAGFSYAGGKCDSTIAFTSTSVDTSALLSTYVWEYGDGTPADTLHVPASIHKYRTPGDYLVTLTIINANGCIDTYTDTVTRGACLVAAYINASDTLCQNHSIAFADRSTCDGTISRWVWNFGDGTPNLVYTTYQPEVHHTYTTAGVYTVRLKVSTQYGTSTVSDSTKTIILVRPSPVAGFNTGPVCLGTSAVFTNTTVSTLPTPVTYQWDFGDAGLADTSRVKNPQYKYKVPGLYTTLLSVTNQEGCWDTVSKAIRVNGLPTAAFTNSLACSDQPVLFTDASTAYVAALVEWNWRISDSIGLIATLKGDTPSYVFDSAGKYVVEQIITDANGCKDTLVQQIKVNRSPLSAFSITENVDNIQGQVQFNNGSLGASDYIWDFGDGNTSYAISPMTTYAGDGTYPVVLITKSDQGCYDTATIVYELMFKGLYVPNAFAPEGPQASTRIWKPVGVNLKTYSCEIYNSYGALIWSSNKLDANGSPLEGWDGYFWDKRNNGRISAQDVYVWRISAVFRDGTIWTNQDVGVHKGIEGPAWGSVTIIR